MLHMHVWVQPTEKAPPTHAATTANARGGRESLQRYLCSRTSGGGRRDLLTLHAVQAAPLGGQLTAADVSGRLILLRLPRDMWPP